MKQPKVYIYCRVATKDQLALKGQEDALLQYANEAGYSVVGTSCEIGDWKAKSRPALQEVTQAVLDGKVDLVLVNSLNRLYRDRYKLQDYIDTITQHGTELFSVRDQLSFTAEGPRLI